MKLRKINVDNYKIGKLEDVFAAEKPKKIAFIAGSSNPNNEYKLGDMVQKVYSEAKKIKAKVNLYDLESVYEEDEGINIKGEFDIAILGQTCLCGGCIDGDKLADVIDLLYRHTKDKTYIMIPDTKNNNLMYLKKNDRINRKYDAKDLLIV